MALKLVFNIESGSEAKAVVESLKKGEVAEANWEGDEWSLFDRMSGGWLTAVLLALFIVRDVTCPFDGAVWRQQVTKTGTIVNSGRQT